MMRTQATISSPPSQTQTPRQPDSNCKDPHSNKVCTRLPFYQNAQPNHNAQPNRHHSNCRLPGKNASTYCVSSRIGYGLPFLHHGAPPNSQHSKNGKSSSTQIPPVLANCAQVSPPAQCCATQQPARQEFQYTHSALADCARDALFAAQCTLSSQHYEPIQGSC